jgi:hypothetical protein
LPLPPLWCSGHPALFAMCPFCCCCLLFSFYFFPGWGLVCPGGYADLTQDCLWEYCMPLSSPCGLLLPQWFGCWHLAAAWRPSWFLHLTWSGNAMYGLGGVEDSKFCLFLVVFPVICISSISPKFYFWWHDFCFLPLAAILESPHVYFYPMLSMVSAIQLELINLLNE